MVTGAWWGQSASGDWRMVYRLGGLWTYGHHTWQEGREWVRNPARDKLVSIITKQVARGPNLVISIVFITLSTDYSRLLGMLGMPSRLNSQKRTFS